MGTERSAGQLYEKTNKSSFSDTFKYGKGLEWFYQNDTDAAKEGVTFSTGNLEVSDNNNSAASVMRNIGNGDFTTEIHWSDFQAGGTGGNGVVMLRIRTSKDNEDNLVEIQRFNNGQLSLLIKNNAAGQPKTTKTDFKDTEGWFKISYSKNKVTAQYKSSSTGNEYVTMVDGDQKAISSFNDTHILEVRAQAWQGATVSTNIKEVRSTFTKTSKYKYHEIENYENPTHPDLWYGQEGAEYIQNTGFQLTGENGIARVKRNIGDQDLSVEADWGRVNTAAASEGEPIAAAVEEESVVVSEGAVENSSAVPEEAAARSLANPAGAILRISRDDVNYAQLEKKTDAGEICFTVFQNGQESLKQTMAYDANEGGFRINFDNTTNEVDAYYRKTDDDEWELIEGSRMVADDLAGKHVLELMANQGTAASFGKVDIAYNQALALGSDQFKVEVDGITGGVYQLSNPSDGYGTNYVMNPSIYPAYDIDDSRWVGDLTFNVKKGSGDFTPQNTSLSDDNRNTEIHGGKITVSYNTNTPSNNQYGIKDFALEESYELNEAGDQLSWQIHIRNTSGEQLEIGDLGIPLLMNSWWDGGNQTGIYEQNVARHSYVAKDGSYIYWQRPNGDGSFLVMTPQAGTSLEFKDKANEGPFGEVDPSWEGLVEYYIHSQEITKRLTDRSYLNPPTSLTLAAGEEKTYGFTFQWAKSYADLRDILYNAGIVDAVSYPGMLIPEDMEATLALRCKETITNVTGADANTGSTDGI